MVINLRLRLEYFSENELAALGQAVREEQHHRQCHPSSTRDAPPQREAGATPPRGLDLTALPNGAMDAGSTFPVPPTTTP